MKVLFMEENALKLHLKQIRSRELKLKELTRDQCCNLAMRGQFVGRRKVMPRRMDRKTQMRRETLHKISREMSNCWWVKICQIIYIQCFLFFIVLNSKVWSHEADVMLLTKAETLRTGTAIGEDYQALSLATLSLV